MTDPVPAGVAGINDSTWNTCPDCWNHWKDPTMTPGVVHRTRRCVPCQQRHDADIHDRVKLNRFGYRGANYDAIDPDVPAGAALEEEFETWAHNVIDHHGSVRLREQDLEAFAYGYLALTERLRVVEQDLHEYEDSLHLCEAHQPTVWESDGSCVLCEAVHINDELKALRSALVVLEQEIRQIPTTDVVVRSYFTQWADRLAALLGAPEQKEG